MAATSRYPSVVVANLEAILDQRLGVAFLAIAGEPVDPVLRRSQRADFQADAALPLARRLGRNPREVATQVLEHDSLEDLCTAAEVAGPGFINLTVRSELLSQLTGEIAGNERPLPCRSLCGRRRR